MSGMLTYRSIASYPCLCHVQVDSQLRNALQGAKLLGEWIPSLLSGGIVMPGTVQQVTEQCLSAHCTPLPTPRELRHTDGCAGVGEGSIASVSSATANTWIPEEMGVGEGRTASEESSSNIIKQVSAMVKRGCSDQDIVARVRFMPGDDTRFIFTFDLSFMAQTITVKARIGAAHAL